MKHIKQVIYFFGLIIMHQSMHGQFKALMQHFSYDFQEFARVYLHGTQEEKKNIATYAKKSLISSLNVRNYVKQHPHEKRSVPKEERDIIQKTVNSLPKPTKKEVENFQAHTHEVNILIARYISSSRAIPHDKKDKNYKKSIINSFKQLQKLTDFVAKNPGLLIDENKNKQLITALENLKKLFPESKNIIHKHDQTIKNKIKTKTTNTSAQKPTTSKPVETKPITTKPIMTKSAVIKPQNSIKKPIETTSDSAKKSMPSETKKLSDTNNNKQLKNSKKDMPKKKRSTMPVVIHPVSSVIPMQSTEQVIEKTNKK